MFLLTSEELLRFFTAQGIAIFLSLLYDLLMSAKPKGIKHTASNLFDAAVWFFICFAFLMLWQKFMQGEFRWHTVLAVAITNILYYLTIHKPIFTAYCIIVKKIYSFFHIIFKILLTVWRFLVKIIMHVMATCRKVYFVDCEGNCYEKNQRQI